MKQRCMFCHYMVELIHVHGHYQCPKCGINNLPCCDGDNCHTNLTLTDPSKSEEEKESNSDNLLSAD